MAERPPSRGKGRAPNFLKSGRPSPRTFNDHRPSGNVVNTVTEPERPTEAYGRQSLHRANTTARPATTSLGMQAVIS